MPRDLPAVRTKPNYRCVDCGITWPSPGTCPHCGGLLSEYQQDMDGGDRFARLGPVEARSPQLIDMEALAGAGPWRDRVNRRGALSAVAAFAVVAALAAGVGAVLSARGEDSGPWPRPVVAAANHNTAIAVPALAATLTLPGDFHNDASLAQTVMRELPNRTLPATIRQETSAATATQSLVVLSLPSGNGGRDVTDAVQGVQALNGATAGGSSRVRVIDTYTVTVRGQRAIAVDIQYQDGSGATTARQRDYFVVVSGRLVVVSDAAAAAEADSDLGALDRALRLLT